MAITTINIGNAPNDGSGDSVRVAFNKANQNFIELQTRIGNLATGGGTTGLQVNGPVEITSVATPGLFTGTFRLRATAQDPYFDIATTAQGFQGGAVGGITTFTNPQDSTSTTSGAVVVAGGLGVSGTATLAEADILGNINIFRLNMSAGGEMFLPDGSPLGNIAANLGAYQAWANLTLSTVANAVDQQSAINNLTSNAATQSIAISDLNANLGVLHLGNISTQANLGAYQNWANLTLSTVANAVDQQSAINSLTSNAATQSIAISDLQSNAATQAVSLNDLYSNAATQAVSLNDLYSNAATQAISFATLDANVGAFQPYANIYLKTAATFTVTNAGAGAYVINSESNPALYLIRGQKYNFSLNATGHPFWIKTAPSTGTGDQYNTGVENNGAAVGLITFDVPLTAPDILYYNCQIHSAMGGELHIVNFAEIDANVGTLYLGNIATNANLGAYQTWANLNLAAEANVGTLYLGNIATNANLGAYQTWANLNLAPLSQPTFVSNLNIDTGANFFVRHGTVSTFGANVDVGSSDGTSANIIFRNGSVATVGGNLNIGSSDGTSANITVRNGSKTTLISNVDIGNAEGTATNLMVRNGTVTNFGDLVNFFSNIVIKSNLFLLDAAARLTLTSNVDIGSINGSEANITVRNGSRATFGSNVEIGSIDGYEANITVRNGSHATMANLNIGGADGSVGNLIVRNGSQATFVTNVTMVSGGNVHVPEGVEFSIYGANVAVYKSTRITQYPWPGASTGAVGDREGMIAYDTNLNNLLICVANYDGTTNIWSNVAATLGTW